MNWILNVNEREEDEAFLAQLEQEAEVLRQQIKDLQK